MFWLWQIRRDRVSLYSAHGHVMRPQKFTQPLGPGPLRSRTTAIEIDRGQSVFGISVTGKVRFRQERHSGHSSRRWKGVPDDIIDNLQVQLTDDALENSLQQLEVSQSFGPATVSVYEPFCADDHKLWNVTQLSRRAAAR